MTSSSEKKMWSKYFTDNNNDEPLDVTVFYCLMPETRPQAYGVAQFRADSPQELEKLCTSYGDVYLNEYFKNQINREWDSMVIEDKQEGRKLILNSITQLSNKY